jgi:hypothetical protein
MNRQEQIEQFTKYIEAGQIKLGMTRSEIVIALGQPTDTGVTSRRYHTPAIYKYGDAELHFGKKSKDGLWLIFFDEDGTNDPITLLTPAQIKGYLLQLRKK